jgi:hypothetical protein
MTVFTTIVNPSDIHDNRYHNPCKLSPTIQYQIPPTNYLTLFQIQQYISDLSVLPNSIHSNSILSFVISNNSFSSYKNATLLKQHLDILWENSKLQRIDLDFSQFKFREGILQRTIALTNHIQKISQYNVFLSLTIPISKDFKIDENFINLILRFQNEFINFSMLNFLIPKDLKKKNLSWLQITKLCYSNIIKQLNDYDTNHELFIGSIEKYIGFVFDSDIILNHPSISSNKSLLTNHQNIPNHSLLRHSVKATVKQNVIHGEKKNLTEDDYIEIWNWCNTLKINQLQLRSYLSNSKHLNKLIEKNIKLFKNNESLLLPQDMLFKLADEVGVYNVTTSNYNGNRWSHSNSSSISISSSSDDNSVKDIPTGFLPGLPDYETAILDKITQYEHEMNTLIRLPSYKTTI